MDNNASLQILHRSTLYSSREKLLQDLSGEIQYAKHTLHTAEPLIMFYGESTDPKAVIVIGTEEVGDESAKYAVIDVAELEKQISDIKSSETEGTKELSDKIDAEIARATEAEEALSKEIEDEEARATEIDAQHSKDIEDIAAACGLIKTASDYVYSPDGDDTIIAKATDIANAISLISQYAQKVAAESKLSVEDTNSVEMVLDASSDGGIILKSNVKLSNLGDADSDDYNDNILGIDKNGGLYANVSLKYESDRNRLVFKTSGIRNGQVVSDGKEYNIDLPSAAELVESNDGHSVKVTLGEVDSNSKRTVSADVKISSNKFNILKEDESGLLVSGVAKNILYGDTTVKAALDELSDSMDNINSELEKTTFVGVESDTSTLTVQDQSNGGYLFKNDVKLSGDGSIIVSNGGLSANVTMSVDDTTNVLTLKVGNNTTTANLPGVNIVESATYDAAAKDIVITFKGEAGTIRVAVDDLIDTYTAGYGLSLNNNQFSVDVSVIATKASLDSEIASRKSEIARVEALVGTNTASIENLTNSVETINGSVSGINSTLTEYGKDIEQLQKDVQTNANGISVNAKAIEANKESIANNKANIESEVSRATEKENDLLEKIEDVKTNVSTLSSDSAKIASDIETINSNVSTLKESVSNNSASIKENKAAIDANTTSIADEVNRATTTETSISGDLKEEIARAKGVEASLSESLAAEVERAKTAESKLATIEALTAEISRAENAEQSNLDAIKKEEERAEKKESELESSISDLSTVSSTTTLDVSALKTSVAELKTSLETAQQNIDSNAQNISTETTRAKEVEATLATKTEVKTAVAELETEVAGKISKVEIVKNSQSDLQYILKVDGVDAGEINIPKDQFLKSASYNTTSKELEFVFVTSEGETTTKIDISDLVDTYTAGDGLKMSDNKFSVVVDPADEGYLSVSPSGVKISGINAKLSEKANSADVYTKDAADAKFLTEHQDISSLATKEDVATVNDALSSVKTVVDKLDGSVETEGSVKYQVNAVKTAVETSLTAEIERAKAAEQANADAIAVLNGDGTGSVAKSIADAIAVKADADNVYTKHEIDDKNFLTADDIEGLASEQDLTAVKANIAAINVVDSEQSTRLSTVESELVRLNLTTTETNSIKPVASKADNGTTLSADVKLDTEKNNIIKISGNGVYAEVSMSYDKATNTIVFNNGVAEQSFVLSDQSLLTAGSYDSTNKEIVLTITKSDSSTQEIRIPIGDIINDWTVSNEADNLITLTKTAGADGVDLLSAKLSISTHEDNGVLKDNGTLFVSKAAKDHTTTWNNGTTTVQTALDELKTETDKVETLVTDVSTLKTDVAAMKVSIAAIEGDVAEVQEKVANNSEKISENAGAINSLSTQMTALSGEVNDLSNDFNSLKETVEAYEDRISALETNVETLKTELGDLSGDKTIAERLAAIEQALDTLIDFGTYSIS